MGTQQVGSSAAPPDNTHNAGTTTNAQWRSNSLATMPENGYVDTIFVYGGAHNGGSSTFKFCLWTSGNSLLGSTPGHAYGTGYGFNSDSFPSGSLLRLTNGTTVFGGFQASGSGSQLGLLHNSGHYWLQQSVNNPANFAGSEDTFGQFGDMAWYFTYFPDATITAIPSTPVAPGQVFTVTGKSFSAGVTAVSIGGVACPSWSVTDDGHLSVTAPSAGVVGTVQVVTNAGTATSSGTLIVGQIKFGTGAGDVASIAAIWYGTGSGVAKIAGVWVPDGSGGVKRVW